MITATISKIYFFFILTNVIYIIILLLLINNMLKFGKYKGKNINEIKNHGYIQYLSNYNYEVQCMNTTDHICNEECQFKLIINDRHVEFLHGIISNKESYILYWNQINESKNNIWNTLERNNDELVQIRIIYSDKIYFDYETIKWKNKLNSIFPTFYLVLNYPEIIQETRKYLKDNKICLHCGIKMQVIGSSRANGAYHDDWESRMFHKKCFKNLINDRIYSGITNESNS